MGTDSSTTLDTGRTTGVSPAIRFTVVRRWAELRWAYRIVILMSAGLTSVCPGVYPLLDVSEGEVRRVAAVSLFAVALILVPAVPSYAWSRGAWSHGGHGGHGFGHHGFRGHGVVVVGPSFWWGPYWWDYPPPYYAYAPPPVIVQEPPVYVEPPAPPQSYWYYCQSTKAYYPSVQTCAEAWIKVPPRPR